MNVQEQVIPRGKAVVQRNGPELSREARRRLAWMDFYARQGRNARLTCRYFGISPDTFYRWRRRYEPRRLESLEDDPRTRRPHRVRRPGDLVQVDTLDVLVVANLRRAPFSIRAVQIDGGSEGKVSGIY